MHQYEVFFSPVLFCMLKIVNVAHLALACWQAMTSFYVKPNIALQEFYVQMSL